MEILIVTLHILVCVALIMIVLLQTGKGASIGASFGGGASQTLFGGSGASTFLSKATTIIAVIFMLTSLILAYMSGHTSQSSVMTGIEAPIEQSLPATADETIPSASSTVDTEDTGSEATADQSAQ